MSTTAKPSEYRGQGLRVAAAVEALMAGRLVILPTETVYGVAAYTAFPAAVSQLLSHAQPPGGQSPPTASTASTWHAPSAARVIEVLRLHHPLHLRLVSRLAPGPVRFLVQKLPREAEEILKGLGLARGVIDREGEFSVRIPDHPLAVAALEQVPGVVIADRASAFGLGDGRTLPEDAAERGAKMGVTAIIDDGPTRLGKPSTPIHLGVDGTFDVVPGGMYDERYIRRKIERGVLFVCTGNTCRSPMAEAIAQDVLAKHPSPIPTRVTSAGVAAEGGGGMTPEAREALEEMGVDAGQHRSRGVTREMVKEAEVVFAMTRSHRKALVEMMPDMEGKVFVLDPEGQDVKDPIGGSQDEYRSTAQRLRHLIERRLRELDAPSTDRSRP